MAVRLADFMKTELKVGHGLDLTTTSGPLTTPRSMVKAKSHVKNAIKQGAKVVTPIEISNKVSKTGYFFPPTLVLDASDSMLVAFEESFAPIVSLFRFDTEQKVLRRANNTSMGLTSYVFTQNADRIWRIMEGIETNNVEINIGLTTLAEAPFGGWHDSLGTAKKLVWATVLQNIRRSRLPHGTSIGKLLKIYMYIHNNDNKLLFMFHNQE